MKFNFFSFTIIVLFFISCNNGTSVDKSSGEQEIIADAVLPPVETRKPNTIYEPAYEGQTRIGGIKTQTAYESAVLTSSLNEPWGIVTLPDGRFLITQKQGSMVIVSTDGTVGDTIDGLPVVYTEGQGGLLGLTLDPEFQNNRLIYWCFSKKESSGSLTAVAKGRLSDDEKKIEDIKIIYRATPAFNSIWHYGGRIIFDKEGNLFVSTGERGEMESRPQAQKLNSALGKILRIDKDGKPAKGNPFENTPGDRAEIWTYGHRNVQGLAINPLTGDLWESEFGPLGGDEINVIKPGKNYGWPIITYGYEYSGDKVGDSITKKEGLEQPVYYWDPVLSPSGIIFYNSEVIREWKNNLFVCGLSGNNVTRLRIENNKVTGEERLMAGENQRFRDITQGKDGNLYVITDGGRLYRLGIKS